MSFIEEVLAPIPVPRVVRIRQRFPRPIIRDVATTLMERLRASRALGQVRPGMRIAVSGGSRGVTDYPLVLKGIVGELQKMGAEPFVFPAMGSHGGATAEGQTAVLKELGITEEYVEAPVYSSMETVQVGTTESGLPVHVDRLAWEADGIVVVNRVKPHVGFRGAYESGLIKMIAIGLGKQRGAEICHQHGFGLMEENMLALANVCLDRCNILFAVGLLENAYHETCRIEVLGKQEILEAEPALQAESKTLLPRIHFNPLDVLILDEIGKNIGGTGFDNNVVGRFHTPYVTPGPDAQRVTRIVALDLSAATHGNGNGLGILDFTTRRVFEKFDFEQTYPNSLTSTVPISVKIPMVLSNDRQAIQAAIKTCNIADVRQVRFARVRNTLCIDEMEVSENLLSEAERNQYVEILSDPYPLPFDKHGNLF